MAAKYEYKFVRFGEGWMGLGVRREAHEQYELIFEREVGAT